ncbi:MAG: adenylyl-sulfate kinase [Lachnospiraceae bacterium]|nr:adenylyl-sulfate kinase [Lachnospiraceae bacterium]
MKELLKFITCGSVDDGKSTLIGHMLYDAKLLFADQKCALELDSRVGSREGEIDYSLLLDGLMAEREQGITIDVAYRYFTTKQRSFIVADTPGHEEYTRNMAVGASFADLAVILVDASKGVLVQTRRHTRICSLIGIRHFVFAINKMDLINFNEQRYQEICAEIKELMEEFTHDSLCMIPVSATEGDNVTQKSEHMNWYTGETLLSYLENIEISTEQENAGFVLPVQRVSRPNYQFRGFQGQVESGQIGIGEEVTVLPSRENAKVKGLYVGDKPAETICKGQPVTLLLDKEIDVSRGCVLIKNSKTITGRLFRADLLWLSDEEMLVGKSYYLKLGTKQVPAVIMNIKYKTDVNSGKHLSTETLYKNEIATCDISISERVVFDNFEHSKNMGSFILIDRLTNATAACGVVKYKLRRDENLFYQQTDITRQMRSNQKAQKPVTLWFTGLSGAGKSTLANAVEKHLFAEGKHTMLLDGDNVRMGLNNNLGFKEKDRVENIRRVAEVAKLMNDAGLIVLAAFISPYSRDREMAEKIIGQDNFIEIYVSTPLEECEKRDVKGLYKKARKGEIPNFTGISEEYQMPVNPALVLDTSKNTLEQCVQQIMECLKKISRNEL